MSAKKPVESKASLKYSLVVTDEKTPKIAVKSGMRFEVRSVTLVGTDLGKPKALAARLCGGTSTCLALVDLSD